MGGALAEVAIAVNLMPKNMIGIGTGLVIVGGALEIIANCMSKLEVCSGKKSVEVLPSWVEL